MFCVQRSAACCGRMSGRRAVILSVAAEEYQVGSSFSNVLEKVS